MYDLEDCSSRFRASTHLEGRGGGGGRLDDQSGGGGAVGAAGAAGNDTTEEEYRPVRYAVSRAPPLLSP